MKSDADLDQIIDWFIAQDYLYCRCWILCNSAQCTHIINNMTIDHGASARILNVPVDQGASSFIIDFLKIVSPHLPFEIMVAADIEHLIMELHPLFSPKERYVSYRSTDGLREAYSKTGEWWRQSNSSSNYIVLILTYKNRSAIMEGVNVLSALRLVSYCSS